MARKGSHNTVKPKASLQIATAVYSLKPWLQAMGVVSVAITAVLIYGGMRQPLHYLSSYNIDQMKDVFIEKNTWVVLCKDGDKEIPSFYHSVAKSSDSAALFGVLDCNGTLPSGKSVYDKFGIDSSVKPTIFVSIHKLRPQQALAVHVSSELSFSKWIKDTVEPHSYTINSSKELKDRCLDKNECLLLLKAGPISASDKIAMKNAMSHHRSTRFATLESLKYETSIEKKLAINTKNENHIALYFRRPTIPNNKNDKGSKTKSNHWSLGIFKDNLTDLDSWLDKMSSAPLSEFIALSRPVTLKKRSVKKNNIPEKIDANSELKTPNPYEGKSKLEITKDFLMRQATREAEKRSQMDKERNDVFSEVISDAKQDDSVYEYDEEVVDLDL